MVTMGRLFTRRCARILMAEEGRVTRDWFASYLRLYFSLQRGRTATLTSGRLRRMLARRGIHVRAHELACLLNRSLPSVVELDGSVWMLVDSYRRSGVRPVYVFRRLAARRAAEPAPGGWPGGDF